MDNPIIFLDLETTGVDISKDRIVEIACVKFYHDGTVEEKHTIVNPLIPIPAEATKIHGITDEAVKGKPTFKQLSKSILSFISGCNIAGYNSNSFDVPMLYSEFYSAGIEWDYTGVEFIDVCNIFKRKEPRDLTAAMKFYLGQEYTGHSALIDAKATMKVFAEQSRRYDLKDQKETALYSNYDRPFIDMGGWFDENKMLAKGKSKGTQDKGFIEWMLSLPDLLPDARKICNEILSK